MNMLIKLSGALSADDDTNANPAAIVRHSGRGQHPSFVAERRQRRRDRLTRV